MKYGVLLLVAVMVLALLPIVYQAYFPADPFIVIAIKETWGVSRYNYTIPIVLDSTNFQYWTLINSTNVYFTLTNGTPLYYWIEALNVAPGAYYAKFWVKIPYIPAYGTVYIDMHFGGTNPYLSYKSARNVFIFWRGFAVGLGANATTYITDPSSGYVNVSNGKLYLYMNGTNTYGSVMVDWDTGISMQDVQVIARCYWEYANEAYPIAGVFLSDGNVLTWTLATGYTGYAPNHGYMYAFFAYNSTIYKLNNTIITLAQGAPVPSGYSYDIIFTRHGAGLVGQNGINTLSGYDYTYTNMTHIGFFIWESYSGSGTAYTELVVNWIAVRRYIAPDPTVTVVNGTTTVVTTTNTVTSVPSGVVLNETYPATNISETDSVLIMMGFFGVIASYYFLARRRKIEAMFTALASFVYGLFMYSARAIIVTGYEIVNGTKIYEYNYNPIAHVYVLMTLLALPVIVYVVYTTNFRRLLRLVR